MSESAPTVLQIKSGTSQKKGGFAYSLLIMGRGQKTHCAICKRGVVMTWKMGEEPKISDCLVCGAETTIQAEAQFYGRKAKR